jgi:hypothetical protein
MVVEYTSIRVTTPTKRQLDRIKKIMIEEEGDKLSYNKVLKRMIRESKYSWRNEKSKSKSKE